MEKADPTHVLFEIHAHSEPLQGLNSFTSGLIQVRININFCYEKGTVIYVLHEYNVDKYKELYLSKLLNEHFRILLFTLFL